MKALAIIRSIKLPEQSNFKEGNSDSLVGAVGTAINLGLYRWTDKRHWQQASLLPTSPYLFRRL